MCRTSFVALATGHEPIYTLDRYLDLESGEDNGIRIPEGKEVYIYLPSRVKELRLTTPEYTKTYTTFTDHLYVINACDESMTRRSGRHSTGRGRAQEAVIYTCPDAQEVKKCGMSWRKTPLEDIRRGAAA